MLDSPTLPVADRRLGARQGRIGFPINNIRCQIERPVYRLGMLYAVVTFKQTRRAKRAQPGDLEKQWVRPPLGFDVSSPQERRRVRLHNPNLTLIRLGRPSLAVVAR